MQDLLVEDSNGPMNLKSVLSLLSQLSLLLLQTKNVTYITQISAVTKVSNVITATKVTTVISISLFTSVSAVKTNSFCFCYFHFCVKQRTLINEKGQALRLEKLRKVNLKRQFTKKSGDICFHTQLRDGYN